MSLKTARSIQRSVVPASRILFVLTLANILNMYDRTIPAIVVDPLKAEFGLSDVQIGLVTGTVRT